MSRRKAYQSMLLVAAILLGSAIATSVIFTRMEHAVRNGAAFWFEPAMFAEENRTWTLVGIFLAANAVFGIVIAAFWVAGRLRGGDNSGDPH